MKKELRHPNIFSRYKTWRHNYFPKDKPVIDIDFVEIRNNEIVAIIETTMFKFKKAIKGELSTVLQRARFQLEIQKKIAEALHVPLYLVIHNESLSYFLVYDYQIESFNEMNRDQYVTFIMNLGKNDLKDWM